MSDALDRARRLLNAAPAEALAAAEEALAALPPDADAVALAVVHRLRGMAMAYLGRHEEALRLLLDLHATLPADGLAAQCDIAGAIGVVYGELGALDDALEWALRACDAARALGESHRLGTNLQSVGIALARSGDHAGGLAHYLQTQALWVANGNRRGEMFTLNNIGIAYKNLGRDAEAVQALQAAMAIADELGEPGTRATMQVNLSEPLARLGRRAEALQATRQAITGLTAGGNVHAWAHAHVRLGEMLLDDGDLDAARAAFETTATLVEDGAGRNHDARIWLGLARVHKAAGRFDDALAAHERYHAAERRQFNEESDRRLRALQVRHQLQQARQEAELLRLRAAELAAQSRTDALTGLANRRHLDERLAQEVLAALAAGRPLAVALMDIDDFKHVNDRLGHATGDAVLRAVAALLRARGRAADLPARYGGEEFCLALPGTDASGAAAVCEDIRAAVQAHDWAALHPALRVTLSIGIASLPAGAAGSSPDALLRQADHHLYDAKRRGKNQVRPAA